MGRLENDPVIHHFSHKHPLQLTYHQEGIILHSVSCSGCNLPVTGWAYECKPCGFYLDTSCSQTPQHIQHPADQNHILTLFPLPVYAEGFFECNACGGHGMGFCFRCSDCELDIHVVCAKKPLSVNHNGHHHALDLNFSSPYPNNNFVCDVCKKPASNQWLYRCEECEFDAHLGCITTGFKPPIFDHCQPSISPHEFGSANGYRYMNTPSSAGVPQFAQPVQSHFAIPGTGLINGTRGAPSWGVGMGYPSSVVGEGKTGLTKSSLVEGFMEGAAQQLGQMVMQGVLGGSGMLGDSGSSGLGLGLNIVGNLMGLNS